MCAPPLPHSVCKPSSSSLGPVQIEQFDCLVLLAWNDGWQPNSEEDPTIRTYSLADIHEAWVQQVMYSMMGNWTALFRLGCQPVEPGSFDGFPPEVIDQAARQLIATAETEQWTTS